MLKNAPTLAIGGVDTEENEHCKVLPALRVQIPQVLTFMAGPSRATATTWAVRMPRTRTAKGLVTCSRSSTSCDTKQSWEQRNSLSRCFLMKLGCCQLWVRMDFYRTFLLGLIWKTWSPPSKRSHYSSTQAYSSQSPARRDERGATSDR